MYYCAGCDKLQPAGVRCNLTPLVIRPKEYHYKDKKTKRDKKSIGWEIVKEVKLCDACAATVRKEHKDVDTKGRT